MTVRLADDVRNGRVDEVRDQIDAGSGAGIIRIYTGSQPAGPGSAATGTLLVTLTLNDPSFPNAASGTTTIDNTPVVTADAVAAGVAGWARFLDSDLNAVMDVTVGESASDLTINESTLAIGQAVSIDSGNPLTLTDPA